MVMSRARMRYLTELQEVKVRLSTCFLSETMSRAHLLPRVDDRRMCIDIRAHIIGA